MDLYRYKRELDQEPKHRKTLLRWIRHSFGLYLLPIVLAVIIQFRRKKSLIRALQTALSIRGRRDPIHQDGCRPLLHVRLCSPIIHHNIAHYLLCRPDCFDIQEKVERRLLSGHSIDYAGVLLSPVRFPKDYRFPLLALRRSRTSQTVQESY